MVKNKKSSSSRVVILTGLPGSGKSYLSTQLETKGWVRVNQDDLGSVQECKKLFEKSLLKQKNVIVDRCNVHSKDRKMWITEAKRLGVSNFECVFFNVPAEECITRVKNRKSHPTLKADNAEKVIKSFEKGLEKPIEKEGFSKIHVISTNTDARNVIKALSS